MNAADADIINEWMKKYSDIFFNYTYKRVKDSDMVKDIMQETFISAWKNTSSFKKKADEKTWLFAILKNKLIDHYRLQAKLAMQPLNSDHYFDEVEHWTDSAAPLVWQNANEAFNNKEFYTVLDICKSKLSRLQQLVFTMKYIDEHETNFICKVLNITASNYWVIIHRSKLNLRNCLEKNWFGK
jgi:RNA polymerase sigma-70 factor (ECF subfamily)